MLICRAFVDYGCIGQHVVAKIKGIWHRSEIIKIISPVDYIVESKETLAKEQLVVTDIKILSFELSMIRIASIKWKLNKIIVDINKRNKFIEWRSSVYGPLKLKIIKIEEEIYHVELYYNNILLNLIALKQLSFN